jgi:hypothetical protein
MKLCLQIIFLIGVCALATNARNMINFKSIFKNVKIKWSIPKRPNYGQEFFKIICKILHPEF